MLSLSTQAIHAEAASPVVLTACGLGMTYRTGKSGDVVALTGVNFDIRHGELVSLVGPSGCGKSTLLRLMSGLITSSEGTLMLGGEQVRGPGPKVAVVFQAPILLPWRTILQNVLLPVEFREWPLQDWRHC